MAKVELCLGLKFGGEGTVVSWYRDLPGIPRVGDRIAFRDLKLSETFVIDRVDGRVDEVIWYADPDLEAPWMKERPEVWVGCEILDSDDLSERWHLDEAGNVVESDE